MQADGERWAHARQPRVRIDAVHVHDVGADLADDVHERLVVNPIGCAPSRLVGGAHVARRLDELSRDARPFGRDDERAVAPLDERFVDERENLLAAAHRVAAHRHERVRDAHYRQTIDHVGPQNAAAPTDSIASHPTLRLVRPVVAGPAVTEPYHRSKANIACGPAAKSQVRPFASRRGPDTRARTSPSKPSRTYDPSARPKRSRPSASVSPSSPKPRPAIALPSAYQLALR